MWVRLFVAQSVVSDYRLDDPAIEVRSPAKAKDFISSLCVQTGSKAHPAYYAMVTGDPIPGGNALPGCDADHSPPYSAEVVNEWELYSSPLKRCLACSGTALLFSYYDTFSYSSL
jgi:hypothetical protein